MKRISSGRMWLLVGSGALALSAGSIAAAAASASGVAHVAEAAPGGPPCIVPEVARAPLASAEAQIVAAGCAVGTVTRLGSRTVPAGEVLSLSAFPGTQVPHGLALSITVSAGAPCTVPKIGTALTLKRITGKLTAADCTLGKVHHTSSSRRHGTVVKLSPSAGKTLQPKAAVQVYLAR